MGDSSAPALGPRSIQTSAAASVAARPMSAADGSDRASLERVAAVSV
jgi:hypothetical protein